MTETQQIAVRHLGVFQFAMVLMVLFLVLPPAFRGFGNYALASVAQPLTERYFPVFSAGTAINPATGLLEEWPPFTVDEKRWDGAGLVIEGRFCKVRPYAISDAQVKFGWPEGPQEVADATFQGGRETPVRDRANVCQYWGPWTITNAQAGIRHGFTTFFLEFEHLPEHGLFPVTYVTGTFDIPPWEGTPRN